MQIDWFTLTAQVVNFLILVWLLKRFLYGRIVQAMNDREARIASRLDEAKEQQAEAEREAQRYRKRQEELDAQREEVLQRARENAEARRQQLVEEARQDVEQMRAQWFENLQQEKAQFLHDLSEQAGQRIFDIVRRALKDLAGADLQQQMVATFLRRIRNLEPAERDLMAEAIRTSGREAEFRSAYPIGEELRERITQELREHLEEGVVVRFEVEPALGCGIELYAHSHRQVWNLESYLEALESEFFQALEDKAIEHGKSQPDPANARRNRRTAPSRP